MIPSKEKSNGRLVRLAIASSNSSSLLGGIPWALRRMFAWLTSLKFTFSLKLDPP